MSEVTIGLPVYNGAATIRRSIDALLSQTYTDFILLVSDNASTDATPEILAGAAARDSRVHIVRQPRNIGSTANYQYLVDNARTPKFGWFAADDIAQPTYLERCAHGLDAAPGAVICCTDVIFVLATGERWKYLENMDTLGCTLEQRFHRLIDRHGWYATYGVGWTDLMQRNRLIDRYGGDVTLLAKWLVLGDIACIHEPLMHFSFVPKDAAAYAKSNSSTEPVAPMPFSQMFGDIGSAIRERLTEPGLSERIYQVLARTMVFENSSLADVVLREFNLRLDQLDVVRRFEFFLARFRCGAGADPLR